jgi:hypothetical protein
MLRSGVFGAREKFCQKFTLFERNKVKTLLPTARQLQTEHCTASRL